MAVSLAVVRHHKAAQVVVGAQPTVAQLVCMWLADDPAGWAGLHELFDRQLRQYLLRVCGRLDDVYDLAMATWIQARAGLATYDPSLPFLPWLQRVGLHVFFDLYRKEKPARRVTMPEEDAATLAEYSADGPGAALYAGLSAEDLHRAIDRLEPIPAAVVVLHHLEGLSYAEIGERLHINEATLRSIDMRARLRLRVVLEGRQRKSSATKRPANP